MRPKPPALRLCALLAVFAVTAWCAFQYHRPPPPLPVPIWIAHALGGIEGQTYTNSREAFLHNYDLGFRLFEVDLSLTENGTICAFHDAHRLQTARAGSSDTSITQHTAPQSLNYLCLEELTTLIKDYPQARFIVDIKEPAQQKNPAPASHQQTFQTLYRQLDQHWLNSAEQRNWQQIIPQIYNEDDLLFLQSLRPFDCVIYTLYRENRSDSEVLRLIDRHPTIRAVTVDRFRFNRSLATAIATRDRRLLIHTLNDPGMIHAFHAGGASGFYTDFHPPVATTQPAPTSNSSLSSGFPAPTSSNHLCGSETE